MAEGLDRAYAEGRIDKSSYDFYVKQEANMERRALDDIRSLSWMQWEYLDKKIAALTEENALLKKAILNYQPWYTRLYSKLKELNKC